ncbi:MAG: hypothetical protein ACODAJ_15435, partial [Planctomycetota bacterium]
MFVILLYRQARWPMKKLLLVLAVLAIAVMALAVLYPRDPVSAPTRRSSVARPTGAREKAPWEPYAYQCRQAPTRRRYNLPVIITTTGHPEPTVRLLLDVQDPANYYFVELTGEGTRIGKVESGLETPLGTHSPVGLRPEDEHHVVVKRRHAGIVAVLNDRVAARATDETFHGGQVGAGVLEESAIVRFGTPQPCDPVYVTEGFMKVSSEGGQWASVRGSWQIAEIRNPSLSSNAFYYIGRAASDAAPAVSVRGHPFWDDYRLRVACASRGSQDVGIFFYYRDPNNYWLFRWTGGKAGRRQLVRRWHGEETVLAEEPGGYQRGVWYELEVEVVGPRIRTFIDGRPIFKVTDDRLCFGQIGLYSAVTSPKAAHFDDVLVQSVRGFEDDFSVVAARRWRPLKGSWEQRAQGDGHFCFVSADGPAKAIAGSRRWRDRTTSATLRLPGSLTPQSEAGVVGHYLDETNYAVFAWKPGAGTARLEAQVDGERTALAEVQAPKAPAATRHILDLTSEHGVLTARLDGQALASAWVPGLRRGRVGLYAADVDGLAYDRVQVGFPLPPEPVLTTNEVFRHEHTMQIWAGAAQDWEATSETVGGRAIRPRWHRATFFGDATIEAQLAEAQGGPGRGRSVRLVLSAESTGTVTSGYNFLFTLPPAEGAAGQAVLTRGSQVVGEAAVSPDAPIRRLRLRRIGRHLVASVNDEQVLGFKDPEPLEGFRAAYAAMGLTLPKTDVQVFSDNVKVYTFSRAIADWRTGAGTWAVTNRWECDPRWSFFSGVPDDGRLAALWNKYAFEGDVTVEFAIGPKMERARGSSYRYARDFNVTLCADGKDISSGYSFLFGGWDNARTAILRRDKLLEASSHVIPRGSGIHRRWFYVKAAKRGNTLTLYVDGSRVLTARDPDPLTGSRVAIWSWDCKIMIARVRISASRIGDKEPPVPVTGPCRTIY